MLCFHSCLRQRAEWLPPSTSPLQPDSTTKKQIACRGWPNYRRISCMAHSAPGRQPPHRRHLPGDLPACSQTTKLRRLGLPTTVGPNGVACPGSGSRNILQVKSHKPQSLRCRDRRKCFSIKTWHSLIHGPNLGLQVRANGVLPARDWRGQPRWPSRASKERESKQPAPAGYYRTDEADGTWH